MNTIELHDWKIPIDHHRTKNPRMLFMWYWRDAIRAEQDPFRLASHFPPKFITNPTASILVYTFCCSGIGKTPRHGDVGALCQTWWQNHGGFWATRNNIAVAMVEQSVVPMANHWNKVVYSHYFLRRYKRVIFVDSDVVIRHGTIQFPVEEWLDGTPLAMPADDHDTVSTGVMIMNQDAMPILRQWYSRAPEFYDDRCSDVHVTHEQGCFGRMFRHFRWRFNIVRHIQILRYNSSPRWVFMHHCCVHYNERVEMNRRCVEPLNTGKSCVFSRTKNYCLVAPFYGQHNNRIITLANAIYAANGGTLYLDKSWSQWFETWFHPMVGVVLYKKTRCTTTFTAEKTYHSRNLTTWNPIIPFLRLKSSGTPRDISVHRRWHPGCTLEIQHPLCSGATRDSINTTCRTTQNDIESHDLGGVITLYTDNRNSNYDNTFKHQSAANFQQQMWEMAHSTVHFGNPLSSVDYVLRHWRRDHTIWPKGCIVS